MTHPGGNCVYFPRAGYFPSTFPYHRFGLKIEFLCSGIKFRPPWLGDKEKFLPSKRDFLQVFVPSFLYFALFTFHIFFFTKLNMKTQFEIEFLPPNNGGKKVLEKYTAGPGLRFT